MNIQNKVLRLVFLYNGIFVFAASLLGPLYAVYVQNLGQGIVVISTSWSVFLLSSTLFTLLVIRIGDRIPKYYLWAGGCLMRAIVWFLYIFVGDVTQLIMLQVLLGLGEALGTPAFSAIFAEHLDKDHHVADYADWHLIATLVTALGTFIGGIVVNMFGFPSLFIAMSLLALLSFFGILLHPKTVNIN